MKRLLWALGALLLPSIAQAQIVSGPVPNVQTGLTTTVTALSNHAAFLAAVMCDNGNTTTAYVQVFDTPAAANVTLGTTTPNAVFPIGPNAGGFVLAGGGFSFRTGIQVAATTTATGNTALGTTLNCTFGLD